MNICYVLWSKNHIHYLTDLSIKEYNKAIFAHGVSRAIYRRYGILEPSLNVFLTLKKAPVHINSWFSYPCFELAKRLEMTAKDVAEELAEEFNASVAQR